MDRQNRQKIVEAAQLLSGTLRKLLVTEKGVHAQTLVVAAARMAGTMLYRAFCAGDQGLRPGSIVMSDGANKYGPVLMNTMFATLRQLGHGDIDEKALHGAGQTTASSHVTLADTQTMFEPWYRKTQEVCGLSPQEMAGAAAITAGILIHECREVLDVNAGCAIAVHGMVESAKTVPASCDEAEPSGRGALA